jgi:Tfp pilus assembly protein PilP
MEALFKFSLRVLILVLGIASVVEFVIAQEQIQTPSQKTKEAVEKLAKTPATIGKSLGVLTEAANAKLKQVFGEKPDVKTNTEPDDTSLPPRKPADTQLPRYSPKGKRDPFVPYTVRTKSEPAQRQRDESLPPILRYDIGEFKLVGIAGYEKGQEWKALILDPDKKSYTLTVGMDIGSNHVRVKAINSFEVVFEDESARKNSRSSTTWSCIVGTLCSKPTLSTNKQSR